MFHHLKWNWSQEIKKEQTYIKEEVIEVQIQKKSNKQKRNDTIRSVSNSFLIGRRFFYFILIRRLKTKLSNLESQLTSQMQSGTFGKKRFTAADL